MLKGENRTKDVPQKYSTWLEHTRPSAQSPTYTQMRRKLEECYFWRLPEALGRQQSQAFATSLRFLQGPLPSKEAPPMQGDSKGPLLCSSTFPDNSSSLLLPLWSCLRLLETPKCWTEPGTSVYVLWEHCRENGICSRTKDIPHWKTGVERIKNHAQLLHIVFMGRVQHQPRPITRTYFLAVNMAPSSPSVFHEARPW